MPSKLTALTEATDFLDTDIDYIVKDPGGAPLQRKVTSLTRQRYYPMPQDSITGLGLANNVTDANNDINIAAGRALADSGDYNLILTSALVKQLDAAWVVGTNQGGIDAGAKANSTWYHVWLIGRVDTHVVDVLFSTSATAPTMPANYTKKRRIGAYRTDSSGNLMPTLWYGDYCYWKSPPFLDVDDSSLTTAKKDYALSGAPTGLVVEVFANARVAHGTLSFVYMSNPNFTDIAASATALPLASIATAGSNVVFSQVRLLTDTSAQISARATASSTTLRLSVIGWKDPRGKW